MRYGQGKGPKTRPGNLVTRPGNLVDDKLSDSATVTAATAGAAGTVTAAAAAAAAAASRPALVSLAKM